eukprot:34509_1
MKNETMRLKMLFPLYLPTLRDRMTSNMISPQPLHQKMTPNIMLLRWCRKTQQPKLMGIKNRKYLSTQQPKLNANFGHALRDTDIALAIEWINPYHVIMQNGESCSIYGNEAFGYVLLILSSIGFICGICSFISSFIHHKTRHKERKKKFEGCEISMQLFKILIEDIGSLIICLTVYIINGNASDAFYRSYFTSIASMFFSSARNLWTRPCVCKRDGRSWLKDGCLFYQCHCDAYCKIASDYAGNQWTMLGILAPIMALPFLLLEASLLTKQGYKMYWINGECLQPLVTSTGSVSDDALAEYWSMQTVTSAGNYTVTCDAKDSFTNLCDPLFENDLWCMSSQPLVECYVVSENGQYCTVAMAINECTGNRDCFLDEHFTACICVLQL